MTEEPEFTLDDVFRLEAKAREHGSAALTESEGAVLRAGDELLERIAAGIPAGMVEHSPLPVQPASPRERLSPVDRMRYGEWSDLHLEVFLPLIAEWARGASTA